MPEKKTTTYPKGFTLLKTLEGHTNSINRIAWSPDGKKLASPSDDGTIRVWDIETGECLRVFTTQDKNEIYCAAWSPNGLNLATCFKEENSSLKIWNVESDKLISDFNLNFDGGVGDLAWSPDGKTIALACGDWIVRLINTESGKLIYELTQHTAAVTTVAWSPDGKLLATGSMDQMVFLWETQHWELQLKLEGHSREVWDVAWSPNGNMLASASKDKTVCLWDTKTWRQLISLEGHTSAFRDVSFSSDGTFLASKSEEAICLWRCDDYQMVAELEELGGYTLFPGIAFHPKKNILATLNEDNTSIRIWELDYETLLSETRSKKPSRYLNAKVVLVGDTGVGKSGLGLVLTGEPWTETGSTHGRRVWVFDSREVEIKNGLEETHEILLWDLAGQPDYRLIHQLHLTEVALALILFDSRSQTDPFAGVRHWCKALRQAERIQSEAMPPPKKYLVAARTDVGSIGVSRERIERIKEEFGIDLYFETSAKEDWGIAELSDAIHKAIDWNMLPAVSSTELFQNIKAFMVEEKESGRLLSTMDDLYRAYLNSNNSVKNTKELFKQFEACIGRVESRGLIQRLSFGSLILLQPELQDVYASAIANAVKDEPDGLGSIREDKARLGDFRIPQSERIEDAEQEKLLLISTVEDLLRHEIALREQGEDGQYLVFPSQLTRENPDLPDPEGKAVIFDFEGAVLNIYATLAVRLSYSGVFKKREMWKNAATYSAAVGGICGMFLREISEGRGELTLFFDSSASEETRFQFEEYIRIHLERRALIESVRRRRIFVCEKCETPVTDLAAKRRKELGFDWISCNVCEPPPRIFLLDREERLVTGKDSKIFEMDRAADTQRKIETAASIIQGKIATNDFDVFLCHNSKDKTEVKKIGELLKEKGVLPWLDEWELRPGLSWQDLLEQQIGLIKSAAVFVGKDGIGPWQKQELSAFLREFVRRGCPVIPVVLDDAPEKPDLPIFLKGMTWVDFRKQTPNPIDQLVWGITGERQTGGEFQNKLL